MELLAGAHSKNEKRRVKALIVLFNKLGRIITPALKDYEQAGEILIRLQSIKGYNIKKSASITNDCLIAASARNMGAILYTQNKKDFQAIRAVFDFKVSFV